jgi:hypothetical protein
LGKEFNVQRSFSKASREAVPMLSTIDASQRGDQIRENSLADGNFLAAY